MGTIPALTFGFQAAPPSLPNGDLFRLNEQMTFLGNSPPAGATSELMSFLNFGGNPGQTTGNAPVTAFAAVESARAFNAAESFGFDPSNPPLGTAPYIFTNPQQNSILRFTSSADSFSLLHFAIASYGVTGNDRVRVFLSTSLGDVLLAEFKLEWSGVQLIALHPDAKLAENSQLANGPSKNVGDFISFTSSAGTSGLRTGLLTLKLTGSLTACNPLGLEIVRQDGVGQVTVGIIDVVVNRDTQNGDTAMPQTGLLNGLQGGYPTKQKCGVSAGGTTGGSTTGGNGTCNTNLCFRSPEYRCANGIPASVLSLSIPQINFGYGMPPGSPFVQRYLGCGIYTFEGNSSQSRILTKYYLAAQIATQSQAGPPNLNNLQVGCYSKPQGGGTLLPLTLSNGFSITATTSLQALFSQTGQAIIEGRSGNINTLLGLYQTFGCN